MVFSSFVFLFYFLPLLLLLYYAVPRFEWKNTIMLLFSLLFYAWGEPTGIVILLAGVSVAWISGIYISRLQDRDPNVAKTLLLLAIVFQIGLLLHFKYTSFLLDTVRPFVPFEIPRSHPGLPIGISFFTFHLISYLVDVYRRQAPALTSFPKLLLYISLFPQLVAGPIVRYSDIQEQLFRRQVTLEGFSYGVGRFAVGLGKKVILANTLSELSPIFLDGSLNDSSLLSAWFGILVFALHIYFDFSGYSDMAIGLGRMFGFTFKENFEYPYISRSATEFWRRWNISVGRFFRDYVYIPLGGNRRHAYLNLFAVWCLTGLWHGASWNFVMWGLYFGIFIALEKSFLNRLLAHLPAVVSHLYFAVLVLTGWVFFYFDSLPRAIAYLSVMFGGTSAPLYGGELFIHLENHLFLLAIALIAATPYPARLHKLVMEQVRVQWVRSAYANGLVPTCCIALLGISALMLVGKTYAPFFYFRF